MDEQFEYEPLPHPWMLRLVQLQPRQDGGEIHCTLILIPGRDADEHEAYNPADDELKVPYDALSYTWGHAAEQKSITLNGKPFIVRNNLYEFLKQWGGRTNPLWIDAICINQKDDEEKSSQIPRMNAIYQYATRVTLWLGPAEDDSEIAIDYLTDLDTRIRTANQQSPSNLEVLFAKLRKDESWTLFNGDVDFKQQVCRALRKFMQRPWWSRVWITQEATVPGQKTVLFCGDRKIFWDSLIDCMGLFGTLADDDPVLFRLLSNTSYFTIQMSRQLGDENLNLLNLLALIRGAQSSDPRDRIYAVLGITNDQKWSQFIKPNYKKSVREVYEDFAHYSVHSSSYHHILDILGHTNEPLSNQLVPSMFHEFYNSDFALALFGDLPRSYLNEVMSPEYDDIQAERAIAAMDYEAYKASYDSRHTAIQTTLQEGVSITKRMLDTQSTELLYENPLIPEQMKANIRDDIYPSDDDLRGLMKIVDSPLFQDGLPYVTQHLNLMGFGELSNQLQSIVKTVKNGLDELASDLEPDDPPISVADEALWPAWAAWPSWLPDWRSPPATTTPFRKSFFLTHGTNEERRLNWEKGIYSASGNDSGPFVESDMDKLVIFKDNYICLRGFRIDIIKSVRNMQPSVSRLSSNIDVSAMKEYVAEQIGGVYGATSEDALEAFESTVIADIVYNGSRFISRRSRQSCTVHGSIFWSDQFHAIDMTCEGRLFAITAGGLMGLVPKSAQVRDEIFLLAGGQVLYVLRPQGDGFVFVGECYVHGMMDGEALERLKDGTTRVETVRLQ